ncbi:7366_t:CDS:2, partial [Funneliformis geosporum]
MITDADPAIDVAIAQIYPQIRHLHCIWHIGQNIPKNLKSKLHSDYEEFAKKFFQCRNKLSIENFEDDYIKLIEDYPNAKAGMQSTSCVKSINRVIKKDLDGLYVSLNDLCASLTRILKKQQNNKEFIAWKQSMLLISPPNIYNTIFQDIDNEIHIHVTFAITEKIHEQMNL